MLPLLLLLLLQVLLLLLLQLQQLMLLLLLLLLLLSLLLGEEDTCRGVSGETARGKTDNNRETWLKEGQINEIRK